MPYIKDESIVFELEKYVSEVFNNNIKAIII